MRAQDKERALASLQRDLEAQKGATMQACAAVDAAKAKWLEEQGKMTTKVRGYGRYKIAQMPSRLSTGYSSVCRKGGDSSR